MQKKEQNQETLYIVPIRFYTRLMILLFGISIFATYADARVSNTQELNDVKQIQLKPPENIKVSPLPGMNHIQLSWDRVQSSVTGYAIYKNGILFDTSPQPYYIDEWTGSILYTIYEITAFDIHGNESNACSPFMIQLDVAVSTDQFHEESVPVAQRPEKDWTR
ncbi:hypothetical protein MHK_002529 [Candidatus Magnetomorum sp. HK-1]|nr:hypothetical protein MHK_002529 [Candidatus Magnetomorum sp. HK-1]